MSGPNRTITLTRKGRAAAAWLLLSKRARPEVLPVLTDEYKKVRGAVPVPEGGLSAVDAIRRGRGLSGSTK